MAANLSQRKRRADAMAAPLAAFAGWSLMATCPRCQVRRYVAVDALTLRYGPDHLVQAVVNRLRCGVVGCARPPSFVRLQSRPDHDPGPPIREVILVGAGAF
jgi:hypothetical protein